MEGPKAREHAHARAHQTTHPSIDTQRGGSEGREGERGERGATGEGSEGCGVGAKIDLCDVSTTVFLRRHPTLPLKEGGREKARGGWRKYPTHAGCIPALHILWQERSHALKQGVT